MTRQSKTARKLGYLATLLVLLLPLWWLARPRTVGETINPGGILAQQLSDAGLSNANLGRIDPTSSAMKLGTFGMRGVAIAILWHQSQEFKKRKDWNNFIASGNQIIRLEPHFASVWEFLGWELAYNASAEFDDYRERFRWVIHGFDFLVEGTEINETSPILRNKAGWTISQKIGIADENVQYRRLLRDDEDFHTRYNTPSIADRDNWLIGIKWYKGAESQYEKNGFVGIRNIAPPLFYSHSRMNLIHFSTWLAKDGVFENDGQKIKDSWTYAGDEWHKYGQMSFNTTIPRKDDPSQFYFATLLESVENAATEARLTEELRHLQPELLEELVIKKWNTTLAQGVGNQESLVDRLVLAKEGELKIVRDFLNKERPDWQNSFRAAKDNLLKKELADDYERLTSTPELFLNEQDQKILSDARNTIGQLEFRAASLLSVSVREIAENIKGTHRSRALDIIQEINDLSEQTRMSDLYRGIMNYPHREREVVVERQDNTIQGRKNLFEARRAYAKGDFDTADKLWIEAMAQWAALIKRADFEDVGRDAQFLRDILDLAKRYVIILDQRDAIFPLEHPLQPLLLRELEERSNISGLAKALPYVRAIFDAGNFSDAYAKMQTLVNRWSGVLHSEEYMPLAPLPSVRDDILAVSALYIETLRKLNNLLPGDFPLRSFTELMLRHDPVFLRVSVQAAEAAEMLDSLTVDEKPTDEKLLPIQAKLGDAVANWENLLGRFPILFMDPTLPMRPIISNTAAVYEHLLKLQGKELPADFPLVEFR